MRMIRNVFPQYDVGMGVRLDLHNARTTTGDPLAFDPPFTRRLILIFAESARSVARATEGFISRLEGTPATVTDLGEP
jgi:hypothetical protein